MNAKRFVFAAVFIAMISVAYTVEFEETFSDEQIKGLAIAFLVLSAVIFLVALVFIIFWCRKKAKSQQGVRNGRYSMSYKMYHGYDVDQEMSNYESPQQTKNQIDRENSYMSMEGGSIKKKATEGEDQHIYETLNKNTNNIEINGNAYEVPERGDGNKRDGENSDIGQLKNIYDNPGVIVDEGQGNASPKALSNVIKKDQAAIGNDYDYYYPMANTHVSIRGPSTDNQYENPVTVDDLKEDTHF